MDKKNENVEINNEEACNELLKKLNCPNVQQAITYFIRENMNDQALAIWQNLLKEWLGAKVATSSDESTQSSGHIDESFESANHSSELDLNNFSYFKTFEVLINSRAETSSAMSNIDLSQSGSGQQNSSFSSIKVEHGSSGNASPENAASDEAQSQSQQESLDINQSSEELFQTENLVFLIRFFDQLVNKCPLLEKSLSNKGSCCQTFHSQHQETSALDNIKREVQTPVLSSTNTSTYDDRQNDPNITVSTVSSTSPTVKWDNLIKPFLDIEEIKSRATFVFKKYENRYFSLLNNNRRHIPKPNLSCTKTMTYNDWLNDPNINFFSGSSTAPIFQWNNRPADMVVKPLHPDTEKMESRTTPVFKKFKNEPSDKKNDP